MMKICIVFAALVSVAVLQPRTGPSVYTRGFLFDDVSEIPRSGVPVISVGSIGGRYYNGGDDDDDYYSGYNTGYGNGYGNDYGYGYGHDRGYNSGYNNGHGYKYGRKKYAL